MCITPHHSNYALCGARGKTAANAIVQILIIYVLITRHILDTRITYQSQNRPTAFVLVVEGD